MIGATPAAFNSNAFHDAGAIGRFFNVGFVLSPDGEVVLRHHKVVPLLPVEHSVTPHNVWDKWIELYGRNLDAFYPVADTAIGRLGFLMANEGSYPENARNRTA